VTLHSEDSEDAARPRRATPAARTPFALIASTLDSPRELEALLRWHGPVVHFPSLAHFCSERAEPTRWAGVVVARASAFDARLDSYVRGRRCLALFGRALEREWPAGVRRLENLQTAEAWLLELAREGSDGDRATRTPRASETALRPVSVSERPERMPANGPSATNRANRQIARTLEHRRGEYLLLGSSDESTHSLLATLRRVRSARHVHSPGELAQATPATFTGVVLLHRFAEEALALTDHPSLVGVWRAEPAAMHGSSEHLLDDEPGLCAFMAHTLAFEHTRDLSIARAIEHITVEYGLSPQQAEVLAVATRATELEERARFLGLSLPEARAALKALSDTARGVPIAALVARIVAARSAT
jgi:hypothetical protein